jgi:hypothetical protein
MGLLLTATAALGASLTVPLASIRLSAVMMPGRGPCSVRLDD